MTDRATARHRAPSRVSTPLTSSITGLTAVVGERMEALGRGGAVIAVSSGLVASMALPASAAPSQAIDGPQTASVPLGAALGGGLPSTSEVAAADLVASPDLLGASPLTSQLPLSAPDSATVTFEQGALHAAALTTTPATTRADQRASRSTNRTAITTQARQAATPKPSPTIARSSGGSSSSSSGTSSSSSALPASRGSAVLAIAARYVGIYYIYGGSTPRGFDCSGYTQYVFKQLGVNIPRTADQQMRATKRISASEAQPGDLVFFVYGGVASHVGIVAGGGMMYDSPHTGASISKRKIYSASVVYGRVVG